MSNEPEEPIPKKKDGKAISLLIAMHLIDSGSPVISPVMELKLPKCDGDIPFDCFPGKKKNSGKNIRSKKKGKSIRPNAQIKRRIRKRGGRRNG